MADQNARERGMDQILKRARELTAQVAAQQGVSFDPFAWGSDRDGDFLVFFCRGKSSSRSVFAVGWQQIERYEADATIRDRVDAGLRDLLETMVSNAKRRDPPP